METTAEQPGNDHAVGEYQKVRRNSYGSDGSNPIELENKKTIPEVTVQTEPKAKSWREKLRDILESTEFTIVMTLFTFWALYQSDIKFAATSQDADEGFLVIVSIIFFIFIIEIIAQSLYNEEYFVVPDWEPEPDESWSQTWIRRCQFGSFYFWLDAVATLSLIFDITWIIGTEGYNVVNGAGTRSAAAGNSSHVDATAAQSVRLVRVVRLVRIVKIYKYFEKARKRHEASKHGTVIEQEDKESQVGAAMSDLINRRVITLLLLMLLIIPLLTADDPDISFSIATQMVHQLAVLNQSDPITYESGLLLAVEVVKRELPVIGIYLNNYYIYEKRSRIDALRSTEKQVYELNTNSFDTVLTFDQQYENIQGALYSIYTTTFIFVLLLLGIHFFSEDVNKLVIGPIEHLVELVRKISANPLGVEYKMMGEKDGFIDGMETTILLTTITKIGALMRVGFGEAGAGVIARNLSESSGGRLNLLHSGVMIKSIFGFCDVRQFTDTTECLQEEVMLFVNRIAHILHSIVVQCSGAANKNIGDAFLLTWKLDAEWKEDKLANIADQALLTFCKALIELSRHQEFICNFSVAANARLYKRFPEYAVRIGSGLHMGWAIEGAIGSNRKIDASYLSPHVSATEYLESSTKAYGVSLLISEPFYNLLSSTAKKYIRQVDRVRRSSLEEPMGLYTYDMDLSINWNDPYRKKSAANKRASNTAGGYGRRSAAEQQLNGGDQTRSRSIGAVNVLESIVENSTGNIEMTSGNNIRNSVDVRGRNRRLSTALQLGIGTNPQDNSNDKNQDPAVLAVMEEARRAKAKETPTIVVPSYTPDMWTEDEDLVDLRHKVSDAFRELWAVGIQAYINGDWVQAKEVFQQTLEISRGKDGPSKFLLEVMESNNVEHWHGYRDESGGGH